MSFNNKLEDILSKNNENSALGSDNYQAFRKINSQTPSLHLIYENGNRQIVQFIMIGDIEYNQKEDAIAISSAGKTLVIQGKNLAPAMDLLASRNIAYFREAPKGYKPENDDDSIIYSMVWVKHAVNEYNQDNY